MHYLYKIINHADNDKVYIGKTVRPEKRWIQHKSYARKEKTIQYIHHTMKKYGIDNFEFEIIACCLTQEAANQTEEILIAQYDSRNKEKGYNVSIGGDGLRAGFKHSAETIEKNRQSHLGKKASEETRKQMSETAKKQGRIPPSAKGRKRSAETLKRMSEAHKKVTQ